MGKTALIVDDSQTARVVLRRMLETHALDVDTAESAESALEYLNDNRPDVIFMDHMMPGMDGLEAVKAIKNNPATATIPIMMYTSQKGEVYVGQARALGAVGVLPKEVEPVEVSKVLASLRVIEAAVKTDTDDSVRKPADDDAELLDLGQMDQNIRYLIQDLFDQQRSIIRRDLLDSYETIAARVVDEIRTPVDDNDTRSNPVIPRGFPDKLQVTTVILTLLVMILGSLYWQSKQGIEAMQEQNDDLINTLEKQNVVDEESALEVQQRLDGYQQSLGDAYLSALRAIEWGINQAAVYDYDEVPLGDRRLITFEAVLAQLREIGFSGQVRIDLHVGDFCLMRSGVEGYELAANERFVTQCDQLGFDSPGELSTGRQQSVAFANFINSSTQQSSGQIRFEVVSLGNSEPFFDYPTIDEDLRVVVWNEIAAENNRIEVTLYPD